MVKGVKVLVSNHGVWVGGRSYEHASVLLQQLPVCNSGDARMGNKFRIFHRGELELFLLLHTRMASQVLHSH